MAKRRNKELTELMTSVLNFAIGARRTRRRVVYVVASLFMNEVSPTDLAANRKEVRSIIIDKKSRKIPYVVFKLFGNRVEMTSL